MADNYYETNLRHVVRPDIPGERIKSPSMSMNDYEALYLAQKLKEWATYVADSTRQRSIALAYIEYINMVVRDEGRPIVHVYAHTEDAVLVLENAVEYIEGTYSGVDEMLTIEVDGLRERFEDE